MYAKWNEELNILCRVPTMSKCKSRLSFIPYLYHPCNNYTICQSQKQLIMNISCSKMEMCQSHLTGYHYLLIQLLKIGTRYISNIFEQLWRTKHS